MKSCSQFREKQKYRENKILGHKCAICVTYVLPEATRVTDSIVCISWFWRTPRYVFSNLTLPKVQMVHFVFFSFLKGEELRNKTSAPRRKAFSEPISPPFFSFLLFWKLESCWNKRTPSLLFSGFSFSLSFLPNQQRCDRIERRHLNKNRWL